MVRSSETIKYVDEKFRIEACVARFKGSVSAYDVVKWLDNFSKADRRHALTILESLRYYATNDIYAGVKASIQKISQKHNLSNVYFVPVDMVGKSGPLICYYVQKILKEIDTQLPGNIMPIEQVPIIHDVDKVLCVVDDFCGSGDTVYKWVNKNKQLVESFTERKVLTIAYMPKAVDKIKELQFEFMGDIHNSVFARVGSPFGSYNRMKPYRELAYKYGKKLYKKLPRKALLKGANTPLGYNNSQALICFEYSSPNNTLPIIWAHRKKNGKEYSWYPLFPRRTDVRLERNSAVKKSLWIWVAEAKRIITDKDWLDSLRYSVELVRLFVLMSLIRHHRLRMHWAQLLSVADEELEEIIELGTHAGFLDNEAMLTDTGVVFMESIRKKIKFNSDDEMNDISMDAYNYVPTKFRGVS